jgi:WD40 repeat protein
MRLLAVAIWIGLVAISAAQKPQFVVQIGHQNGITAMDTGRGGTLLATSSLDYTVKLWDIETGKLLRTLSGHSDIVPAVAFSPDGRLVASGSQDKTLRIWDVETGAIVRELKMESGSARIRFSPDGAMLASGNLGGSLVLWKFATSEKPRVLAPHIANISALDFSPDGKTVATGALDGNLAFTSVATGTVKKTEWPASLDLVRYTPDGKLLVSVSSVAGLLDPATMKRLGRFEGEGANVMSAGFLGDRVYTGDGYGIVRIYGRDQKLLSTIRTTEIPSTEGQAELGGLQVLPDGSVLTAAVGDLFRNDGDPFVQRWDPDGKLKQVIAGEGSQVRAVAFSPDGRWLATGGSGRTIELWDLQAATLRRSIPGGKGYLRDLAFLPDSTLVSTWDDGIVRTFSVEGAVGGLQKVWDRLFGNAALSPSGRLLATAGMFEQVKLWDSNGLRLLSTFDPAEEIVHALAFDGERRIAVGTSALRVYDVTEPTKPRLLWTKDVGVNGAAFAPDGTLATADRKQTVTFWSQSGEKLFEFPANGWGLGDVAFSTDGKTVAASGPVSWVDLWDVPGRRLAAKLIGHEGPVFMARFSPNRPLIASAGIDGTTRLWSTSGKELCRLITFDKGDWAVVTPDGRFDASEGGMRRMHYSVGVEPVELEQLKEAFYEPGLLGKILGTNPEPLRPITPLEQIKLSPKTALVYDPAKQMASVTLTDRGGGIGRAEVYLNGKLVQTWSPKSDAKTARFDVVLSGYREYLLPGKGADNLVSVRAFNADEYLSGRTITATVPSPGGAVAPPNVYILAVGISQYAGEELNLRFASKDAEDMAEALKIGAVRWTEDAARVHVRILSGQSGVESNKPTKENILSALRDVANRAQSTDILIVYLAGHGATGTGANADFYYLTSTARSIADVGGANKEASISGEELGTEMVKIPAIKQVLILDTCASGRLVEKLSEQRDVPGATRRSWERMRDRGGLFMLAGCASDAVSYEASRYGQGLLTYSLLEALKSGQALRKDPQDADARFVDIVPWLQSAADRVPDLAAGIGGIQRPHFRTRGDGRSFDVGRLTSDDQAKIPLAKTKPVIIRPNFEQEEPIDSIRLTKAVDAELRDSAARGKDAPIVFWDVPEQPDAFTIRGRYRLVDGKAVVKVYVFHLEMMQSSVEQTLLGSFEVTGAAADARALAREIVTRSAALIQSPPVSSPRHVSHLFR